MDIGQLLLAGVPAVASIGAAVTAGVFARRSRVAEAEAVRLRQLEERLSSKRVEMYEPLLEHMSALLMRNSNAAQHSEAVLSKFMGLVVVYGSDDVLAAFTRFRTASTSEPPGPVMMRLTADLFAAIRQDLAGESNVSKVDLLGMRLNDIYSTPGLVQALEEPFDDLCKRAGWTPPWPDRSN